jgi:predicted transcriptional regulator
MPQINDIVLKRQEKKFVKKSYRPWDLTGSANDQPVATHEQAVEISQILADHEATSSNDNQPYRVTNLPPENEPNIELQKSADRIDSKSIDNNLDINTNIATPHLDNNLDTDSIAIKKQIDIALVTIEKQIGSHLDNNSDTLREQLDNELNPNSLINRLAKLSGIQRKILEFVVDICLAKNTLETGPIQTEIVTQYVNTTYGSTKISINRLINKEFLSRKKGKTAKGGYINLQITEEIRSVVLEQRKKSATYLDPISLILSVREKMNNPQGIQQQIDNNVSLYSSNSINKINTTDLSAEWKNIDIEPLSEIGFSMTQLKQLVNKSEPQIVQESINHFAYGLQNNAKTKGYPEPLNVLMGVLRKGLKWHEPKYISPQEQAFRQLIAEKKEKKERQEAMIKELNELEYPGWRKKLSEEEMKLILPQNVLNLKSAIEPILRTYFLEKILTPELIEKGLLK